MENRWGARLFNRVSGQTGTVSQLIYFKVRRFSMVGVAMNHKSGGTSPPQSIATYSMGTCPSLCSRVVAPLCRPVRLATVASGRDLAFLHHALSVSVHRVCSTLHMRGAQPSCRLRGCASPCAVTVCTLERSISVLPAVYLALECAVVKSEA